MPVKFRIVPEADIFLLAPSSKMQSMEPLRDRTLRFATSYNKLKTKVSMTAEGNAGCSKYGSFLSFHTVLLFFGMAAMT